MFVFEFERKGKSYLVVFSNSVYGNEHDYSDFLKKPMKRWFSQILLFI